MPKISVIIPVYNMENYISDCLESVLNQTHQNLEIICINDGSTDNSLDILEEYAQKDKRIIIINKQNQGVSAARNEGLKIATGKYIGFVDPDDYIEPETYKTAERFMEEDDELDIVCFGAKIIDEKNLTLNGYNALKHWYNIKFNGKYPLTSELYSNTPGVVWNKLYKNSIIKEKELYFLPYKYNEDTIFNIQYLSYTDKAYYINRNFYNYRFRPNSAVAKYSPDSDSKFAFSTSIEQFILLYKYFEERGKLLLFNQIFYNKLKRVIFWTINPEYQEKDFYIEGLIKFAQTLNENYDWGEEVKHIKNGRFDKIPQLNIPRKIVKKGPFEFKLYSTPTPHLKVRIHGIKITLHYQKIFSVTNAPDGKHKVFNILGIKFKFNIKSQTGEKMKNFIQKILSFKNKNNHKIINICGLKLKFRKRISEEELLKAIKYSQKSVDMKRIFTGMARLIKISKVHEKTFGEFKNSNKGKTVFILGAGPTLNFFEGSKHEAKYIALNRSFLFDKVQFDYTFSNDKVGLDDYQEEFLKYQGNNCIKFMGDLPLGKDYQISEQFILEANARKFFTNTNLTPSSFTVDIDSEPLGNFNSVAFQALQFALFTNPAKIYLVGIDNTVKGHFVGQDIDEAARGNDRTKSVKLICEQQFPEFKNFAQNFYPNTEIISVNPIGLRGLFKDVYTEKYLEENPEIAEELGENIEIFEQKD